MKRFWISWCEPTSDEEGDYRPRIWPLKFGIVGYWCSGWAADMSYATLCAVIDAKDEAAAKKAVEAQGWSPTEWRFVKEQKAGWMPPADRFPPQQL